MVIEFEEIQLLILTWNSPYPKQYFIHIKVEPWHLYRLSRFKIQVRGKLRTIPLFLAAISTTAAATAWAAWPWAAAFRRTSSWRTLLLDGVHFFFWVRTRSLRGRVIDEVWHDYSLQSAVNEVSNSRQSLTLGCVSTHNIGFSTTKNGLFDQRCYVTISYYMYGVGSN